MPRLAIYNPLLAFETGDEFMRAFWSAAAGELDPFILVLEGSVPNEQISGDGHWAALGTDPETGDPIPTCTWIDRLAPRAAAVLALGTCAAYGGIPAMRGQPDRRDGAARLPRHELASRAGPADRQPSGLPGPARQHHRDAAAPRAAPRRGRGDDRARRPGPAELAVRAARSSEAAAAPGSPSRANSPTHADDDRGCLVKLGCKGPVVKCNVPIRGWIGGVGGCPNVGGICMACTMPGFPDKFMPFMEPSRLGQAAAHVRQFTYGPVLRRLRGRAMHDAER